ncbi:putative photosynthetic complex assembly protein 2 [Roseivivax lentus]|uniref:Putative photosynthetic complex assembly protein 2 n=1 Tax=Roseivivax lentus TaxID=633194 RepID=A0A1N7JM45_9RHOB|nr:putative photosynthetic complex assembly protein PuhE [Roseivivax lentus]SIS50326.1 putative photosynthetic complex assembly protein 2 [Roseivivax lentus]
MLTDPWIAALLALFAWWFSTGLILLVVRGADRGNRSLAVTLLSLPVLCLGAWGLWTSGSQASVDGVYIAFLSALAIWGWIELAFLAGVVTGPNTHPCPEGRPGWERFLRAWGTIAYHEMALVFSLIAMWGALHGSANMFGVWTFAVLFVARVSAKLNLFLGVPKINTEFLPSALSHLPSHFRIAPMNVLFPVSITALSFATACWLERIYSATSPAEVAGFALLSALTALALLEHWFMVLPLPDEKLWRWMLPAPKQNQKTREDAHGL